MTRCDRIVLACCGFYAGVGSLWIDRPGLQADEVLFAQPLFDPTATAESMSVFHHSVPLMLMSYLGCLKTLLYAPLIWMFGASAALVRLPMVAAGALSIWVIYRVVARLHSERAGAMVAVMLATDTLYLWLSRCDWGPVTLQHLLAASGVWMLLRFRDGERLGWLGAGGFMFGLALWDKTLFLWPALALVVGAALLWRDIRPLFSFQRLALVLTCFAVGAFPLIRHNVRQRGATFNETAHFSTDSIRVKTVNFVLGLNSVGLLGYMIGDPGPVEATAQGAAGATIHVAKILGFPRQSITGWAFLAALAASAFLGRASRIAALMLLSGFTLMVFTQGGGQWPYHSSVLWPLPHIVIVFALVRLPKPWQTMSLGVIALASLAVTNTHFALLHEYGGSRQWTDAIYQLPDSLAKAALGKPAQVIDWGILEPVQFLTLGTLPIRWGGDRTEMPPGTLYVGQVPGFEIFADSNSRLIEDARRAGCRLRVVDTVADRQGTPMFQLQVCD